MTNGEIILKENIMRRVRFIYGVKSLPRVFVPKFAILASLVAVAGFVVSIPNVLRNMPNLLDIQKFSEFTASAFLKTGLVTQAVAIGTIVVLFYMARDTVKTLSGKTRAVATA